MYICSQQLKGDGLKSTQLRDKYDSLRKKQGIYTVQDLDEYFKCLETGQPWVRPTGKKTRRSRKRSSRQPASTNGIPESLDDESDPVGSSQSNLDGAFEEEEPIDGQQQKNPEMEAKVGAVLRKLSSVLYAVTIESQELYLYLGGENLLNWAVYCDISREVTGGAVGNTEFHFIAPSGSDITIDMVRDELLKK